jgi:hypothetical protein
VSECVLTCSNADLYCVLVCDCCSNALTLHQAGHADNNEVISVQTNRQSRGVLILQFQTTSAWTATNNLQISFYRLL